MAEVPHPFRNTAVIGRAGSSEQANDSPSFGFQQVAQFAISYFAGRTIGQHLKLFQELDYFALLIFAEGDEPLTLWPGLARVMNDRFSEGGQVAAVAIMVLVPAGPGFACDELVDRDTVLNQSLIAKIGVLIVSNDVALQVGIGAHRRAARASWLEPRL